MREIRTSGSEGGGIETNRRSLPLSVTTDRGYWIARSIPGSSQGRAMTPVSLSFRARIGLAGFVQEPHAFFVPLQAQVDVGIFGALARRAGADLQVDGVAV